MTEHAITYKELRRSRDDRMVAGVCGGLARYFDVNPTFYRVGFVVLTCLGGAGILIYGAALLVMPNAGEADSIATEVLRDHRRRPGALVGLLLVGIAGIVLLSRVSLHTNSGIFWVLLLIAGAVILRSRRRAQAPAPVASPDPASPPQAVLPHKKAGGAFGIVFGGLVVAGGALGLLAADGIHIRWDIVLAIAAVAVGIAIVAGGILQRRVGGLAFLGLVLAAMAIVASTAHLHLGGGVGNRTYHPVAVIQPTYRLGIGNLELNLADAALPSSTTRVTARLGIGNLHVIVPQGVSVEIIGHAEAGNLNLLGHVTSGQSLDSTVSVPGGASNPKLLIDAHVDLGQVMVTSSAR